MEYLRKFYFLIFILLFIIIFLINQQNYERSRRIIESKFQTEIELIKSNVFNSLEDAHIFYSISETILNKEMEANSKILLEKYAEDKKPENWNLVELQKKMPDYEIHIINQNLKIVNTTVAADLGLDFSNYKEFSQLLYARIKKDNFVADKLAPAQDNGLINKYSYQPTQDGNYLIELSIDITKKFPLLREFNIFSKAAELTEKYKHLRNINFYKFAQNIDRVGLLSRTSPAKLELVSASTKAMVKKAVLTDEVQSSVQEEQNYKITDIYLPFLVAGQESETDWWNSLVVRVSYDNQFLVNELSQEKGFFLFRLTFIFIVFVFFSLVMSYFIKRIEDMAYHDPLTGLPNRKAFENYFNQVNRKKINEKLAVLYLDLDGFKDVNDNYGHDTGDLLLKTVAGRLKNTLRSKDKLSRMGGDEFTILLTDIESSLDVQKIVKKIETKIAEPYQINDQRINISCSIGYSIDFKADRSFQDLINKADLAMYRVKNDKN